MACVTDAVPASLSPVAPVPVDLDPVTSDSAASDSVTSNPVTSNPVTSNPVTSNPVTSNKETCHAPPRLRHRRSDNAARPGAGMGRAAARGAGAVHLPGMLVLSARRRVAGGVDPAARGDRAGMACGLLEQPGVARSVCPPGMDRAAEILCPSSARRGVHARAGGERGGDDGWLRPGSRAAGDGADRSAAVVRHAAPRRVRTGG